MRTFASILLLFAAGVAFADDGYVPVGNGIYRYGNGSGYYRRSYVQPCYTCGRYTPGYFLYQQVDYTPPAAKPPEPTDDDFDTKVIDYLSLEAKLAQRAEVIKALASRLPARSPVQYGYNLTGQSTTYYGAVHAYQPPQAQLINPNEALHQYGRIVENVQTAGREAVQGFAGVTANVTAESTKAAQIAAALHGAAQVVKATQETKVRTEQFQLQSGPADLPPKQFGQGNAWAASAQRCIACHSGAKKEGGFDVSTFPTMDAEGQLGVFRRLMENKPGKPRMPLNADRSPGQLPPNELHLWIPKQPDAQQAPAK